MPTYPIAPPPEEEALLTEELKEALLERPAGAAPDQSETPPSGEKGPAGGKRRELFSDSLLELSSTRPPKRTVDFFLSSIVHGLLLCMVLLIPLYFTEAIDVRQFTQTFLVAPPPPPPPPAPPAIAKRVAASRRVFTAGGKLLAPTVIPEKVAMIKEEELPPEVGTGAVGGVPGGVPGGQVGGVIGGIISAPRTYIPAAPTPPTPKAPIRVGGRIKAPLAISTPDPVYPPLARQAKIQGDVVIDAVIDPNGSVVEMRVVSGHPLLIPAAMQAMRRWKYEPTYLNEEPVPVQLVVTVKFRLGT